MRTAFIFAGGGSLGAVQVGMLRALVRHGVQPDLVVGASVGAINAAHFAGAPTAEGVDRLASVWRKVSRHRIFPLSATRGLLGLAGLSDGFVDPSRLRRLLSTHIPYANLEDAKLPCVVVATDLLTGQEAGLTRGPVVPAILASAAIPGIFPPVEIAGRLFVDGGVAANTPISAALHHGAERIVVLSTGFTCDAKTRPVGALAVAIQSLNHMIGRQLARDFHRFSAAAELRMVPPICPLPVSTYDFSRTPQLIERASLETRRWIDGGGLDREWPAPPLDSGDAVALAS